MTNREFYGRLNQVASDLQAHAFELTKDMGPARKLYLETVFRAEKRRGVKLNDRNFKAWISAIMQKTYSDQALVN